MFEIKVNEEEARELYLEKLEQKLREFEAEKTWWDSNELKKQTCMSWTTMQDQFFYHPDFPKFKIGQKWYFPARETRDFLLKWLRENGKRR